MTTPIRAINGDKLPCGCPASELTVVRKHSRVPLIRFRPNEFDIDAIMWICKKCLAEIVDHAPFKSVRAEMK